MFATARLDEVEVKRQKLDYEEITPCLKEVTKVWDSMLANPHRPNAKVNLDKLTNALKDGQWQHFQVFSLLVQAVGLKNFRENCYYMYSSHGSCYQILVILKCTHTVF